MSKTNSALKFRDFAMRTPRPYTSKIALNGSLRPPTKPIDSQVQKSFSTNKSNSQYAVKPHQPRDGETGGNGGGKGKNREDELVSFTGEWTKS